MFHSSKKVFLHNVTQFLENWIFEGISTGADLTKMVKICIISICAKKIFFGKIICSTHQRKCFSTMLRNFGKLNFWRNIDRRGPYKNGEYLYYLKLCKEIIFWQNYLFHSSKEEFLHNFRQFLENYFWRNINRRSGPYKNGEYLYYLKLCKEIIFWQNYLFHSSKEEFLHNFRQFLENWIFEGISTGADLTKMVKICIISICAKKYFLAKLFVPLIKESVSPQCYAILENWIFEGISTGADLTKMVNICTILNCAKKIFFGKIICSTHQRKSFSTILGNFWKIEFLKEYQQAQTLQKWWIFVLS